MNHEDWEALTTDSSTKTSSPAANFTTHQRWTSQAPWRSTARVETQEDYR